MGKDKKNYPFTTDRVLGEIFSFFVSRLAYLVNLILTNELISPFMLQNSFILIS